ncbi:hypothetical protein ACFORO_42560 [Amycolatopsis halotolerans]|uniref:Uncharacterized protein n=1 Tax=Amycolatopsis halotolerans TaxID=330083 RepID=A0ABV7QWU1_9PSEU
MQTLTYGNSKVHHARYYGFRHRYATLCSNEGKSENARLHDNAEVTCKRCLKLVPHKADGLSDDELTEILRSIVPYCLSASTTTFDDGRRHSSVHYWDTNRLGRDLASNLPGIEVMNIGNYSYLICW